MRRPTLIASLTAATLALAPAIADAAPTSAQAQRAAKKSAAAKIETYGITYPVSMWTASCKRAGGRWSCKVVSRGGQCAGTVLVGGTRSRPRTRRATIGCGE